MEAASVGLPRQTRDLAVPDFDDHPPAVTPPRQVHREEAASHGGGHPGEPLDRWSRSLVIALGPVGPPEDRDTIEAEEAIFLRQRHPALGVDTDRLELDELPEGQALVEVLALESRNRPTTRPTA